MGGNRKRGPRIDVSGERFGKLVALSCTNQKTPNGDYAWNCICDCGNTTVVAVGKLRSNWTKSCGCLKAESHTVTHGMSSDSNKVYRTWCGIKERCFNPNSHSYKYYGALGITMQESFVKSFEEFYKEVGEPPDEINKWSIDRVDNQKGYIAGNLRWATDSDQARNKTRPVTNTSGFCGVEWFVKKGYTYYRASWFQEVGGVYKRIQKVFSVRKYGLLPAFAMACKCRESKIEELNSLGYGYSENHGKEKKCKQS